MRILFLILTVFAVTLTAQTTANRQIFDAATKLAQSKQFESAIEKYRAALLRAENESADDDFRAQIHFNIGVCLYQSKNFSAAIEEFDDAIKLRRRDYQKAFYARAMAEVDLKNFRQAEKSFRAALKLDQTDGEAWFDLALVNLRLQKFEQAETAFENAVQYKSLSSADAINNIGVIYALKHEFAVAEKQFERALEISFNKSDTARNNLEFCRLYQQKFDQKLLAKLEFSGKSRQAE